MRQELLFVLWDNRDGRGSSGAIQHFALSMIIMAYPVGFELTTSAFAEKI